jgi:hypothetical protein
MSNKNLAVVNTQDTKVARTRAKNLMGVANKLLAKSRAKELEAIKSKEIETLKSKELANPLVWTDPDTNLTWQVDIDKREFTFDEAFDYAKELNENNFAGYNDWKVPTIEELRTILTQESYNNPKSVSGKTFIKKPLLNSMTMKWQSYWSSTIYASSTSYAWLVNFSYGYDPHDDKTNNCFVRCVRLADNDTLTDLRM